VRFGQADQAADFVGDVLPDMRFGELRAEFFIICARRVVDDVMPPDRRGQDFALAWREMFDTRVSAARLSSICARL
jgi:hypothetical protein